MKDGKLKVALAGLGFGKAFVPIWCKHPDVYEVDIIEPDEKRVAAFLDYWGKYIAINKCWTSLEEALEDKSIDAVHIVTPIPLHAKQAVAILKSGKHCASTVPMATSLEDIDAIVAAQRKSGKNYMMMETAVYTYPFLKIKQDVTDGLFGRIQLLRGCHYQDMENWPPYWKGLPPMWYGTHAISTSLALTGCRASEVHCYGSGVMRDDLQTLYHNPYPAETAIFRLENHPAALEVTRTLFQTARSYCEGLTVYGEKRTVDWSYGNGPDCYELLDTSNPAAYGYPTYREPFKAPDTGWMLPKEIAPFTKPGNYDDLNPSTTFKVSGGHHGSHPHLVHEFARSIIENRPPAIDVFTAADWTAAGICAHESAMHNGALMLIPDFRK